MSKYLTLLLCQCAYIPFIFWFIELGQNHFYRASTGSFAWYYPSSPHNHFTFESVGSWTVMCIIFWSVHYTLLIPRRINMWIGFVILAVTGWSAEWIFGAIAELVLGYAMQVWPQSSLKYVGWDAIGWWYIDAIIYQILVFKIPFVMSKLLKTLPGYEQEADQNTSTASKKKV